MLLGEVHQHLLPHRVSADSAIAQFERASADPGFTPPLIHLAEHAILRGNISDAKKLIKRLDTMIPLPTQWCRSTPWSNAWMMGLTRYRSRNSPVKTKAGLRH